MYIQGEYKGKEIKGYKGMKAVAPKLITYVRSKQGKGI